MMRESFMKMCEEITKNLPTNRNFNCVVYDLEEVKLLEKSIEKNKFITNCHITASDEFKEENLSEAENITDTILIKILENKARLALLENGFFTSNNKSGMHKSNECVDFTAVLGE
jgi:hypothetical protein